MDQSQHQDGTDSHRFDYQIKAMSSPRRKIELPSDTKSLKRNADLVQSQPPSNFPRFKEMNNFWTNSIELKVRNDKQRNHQFGFNNLDQQQNSLDGTLSLNDSFNR